VLVGSGAHPWFVPTASEVEKVREARQRAGMLLDRHAVSCPSSTNPPAVAVPVLQHSRAPPARG